MRKQFLLLTGLSILTLFAGAQVRFNANPAAITRNADALLSINVLSNYSNAVEGDMTITISDEASGRQLYTVTMRGVQLLPGTNSLAKFRSVASMAFTEEGPAQLIRTTGNYPPGDYEICIQFNPGDKHNISQQCFYSSVAAKFPLQLVSPADTICNKRPAFLWQGRKANAPGVAYKLSVVEMKKGQSAEEALIENPLVVNKTLFQQTNQSNFPEGSLPLEEGKKYAWQVQEVSSNSVLNTSEIYEFTVGCVPERHAVASFAEVKPVYTGKKYYYTKTVNFSFRNPYSVKKLKYAIVHIASKKQLTDLPVIEMSNGLNQIILDVDNIKGLVKNEQYKIEIYNLGNSIHYLNFIVQE
jgi:hypothetical protein